MQIKEVKAERMLNPTSIDLGEFVINPYKGCELACVYCYVKTNRTTSENPLPWGSYLDIKTNSPEQLQKELKTKKVDTVLLGSTTELFQPMERQYHLSQKIIEILNQEKIHYVILTRSPLILDVLDLLDPTLCKKIYFTVNLFNHSYKRVLEPKSSDFQSRAKAIEQLIKKGLHVITYFCPVLPWISEYEKAFEFFSHSDPLEFEFLNFNLKHIDEIIEKIGSVNPEIGERFRKMQRDVSFYNEIWDEVRGKIEPLAQASGKKYRFFTHTYEGFFENRYNAPAV